MDTYARTQRQFWKDSIGLTVGISLLTGVAFWAFFGIAVAVAVAVCLALALCLAFSYRWEAEAERHALRAALALEELLRELFEFITLDDDSLYSFAAWRRAYGEQYGDTRAILKFVRTHGGLPLPDDRPSGDIRRLHARARDLAA